MFDRFAGWCGDQASRAPAFTFAVGLVAIWLAGGLARGGYPDDYQIPINTITTIVTFVLGFAILNAQRRDQLALHVKLDAILHAIAGAPDSLMKVEQRTVKEIEALRDELDDPECDCPPDGHAT